MLTASARPQGGPAPSAGRRLLHDDSRIMALALQYGEDIGLSPAAVQWSCGLEWLGGSCKAEIADVSREGLGIVCAYPLEERQPLRVALDDGRRLEATVARRQRDRIGLALRDQLSSGDPLFHPPSRG